MRPDAPKRPYVPQGELPGSVWRKQTSGRPTTTFWLWIGSAVLVTAVLVTVLITLLNASGNNISVMVGLTTATPSATPTNTPTPTITPSPTPVNSDDDALIDDRDNCDFVSNPDQMDTDGDNIGDACDDSDSDTIVDLLDNCPTDANTDQSDLDGDGRGDVCDEAVNLTGITLTLASDAPLYLGSSASSVQVSVEGDASAPLVINASQGGFVASDIGCTSGAPRDYTLRPDETSLRYCAPAVSTAQQVRLIIREIGASDQPTGVGGFTTLELQDDVLTPTLAVADVLNPLNATEAARCVFPDALGDGILLELDTIPLVFRLNAEANAATERAYSAIVTLPSGGLYVAQGSGSACQLLTPLDPLTGSPAFEAQINTPYVLYYLPGSATGDATQALTISLPGRSIAPVSLTLLPLLVPTIPLNVRDSNLGIAMSLEEGKRALVTGIGGEGINRWARIRVDGDERELWLNVGQLGGSYRVLGNLDAAAPVTLPSNFGG